MSSLFHNMWFHWGGYINHQFFFDSLAPYKGVGGKGPTKGKDLDTLLKNQFGSKYNFIKKFRQQGMKLKGSGWIWLCYNLMT